MHICIGRRGFSKAMSSWLQLTIQIEILNNITSDKTRPSNNGICDAKRHGESDEKVPIFYKSRKAFRSTHETIHRRRGGKVVFSERFHIFGFGFPFPPRRVAGGGAATSHGDYECETLEEREREERKRKDIRERTCFKRKNLL